MPMGGGRLPADRTPGNAAGDGPSDGGPPNGGQAGGAGARTGLLRAPCGAAPRPCARAHCPP